MTNFKIIFTNPWLLLLLIPAIFLTLFPYFRIAKKYRCTRNRVGSMVLHMIVMVLCISVLAGISFSYDIPNKENEVILLVDTTYSGKENEDAKNEFVETVIDEYDSLFKLGIVTFGFGDPVVAVSLDEDVTSAKETYNQYLRAPDPNQTATDIEAALNFTSKLFSNKGSATIVLISDGIETDGNANGTIKAIASEGVVINTVYFPDELTNEVQINSVTLPERNVKRGETFKVDVQLQSSYEGNTKIHILDNNEEVGEIEAQFVPGTNKFSAYIKLKDGGLHDISFKIYDNVIGDACENNNAFHTYMYLYDFEDILIIESISEESKSLSDMFYEQYDDPVIVNIKHAEEMENYNTVTELRYFDEIILVNISYEDMEGVDCPDGKTFEQILNEYVYDYGGGLFTVCGNETFDPTNKEGGDANAYTKEDMYPSKYYKHMLPVEIIEYTPPVGVIIVIDRSGSMGEHTDPDSPLSNAKKGAAACLDALTERDYVGVMTLEDGYKEEIEMTKRPLKDKILAAIDKIETGGGTVYSGALERAGSTLLAQGNIEKRHIILVTDGQPTEEDLDNYQRVMRDNASRGITMSIIGINCPAGSDAANNMINDLKEHAGMTEENFHAISDVEDVATEMRQDLEAPLIKDVNYGDYVPTIKTGNSVVGNITQDEMPILSGFYGSRLQEGAEVCLEGNFGIPLYAQWQYGKGMVGSFMCDLNGTWSSDFIASDTGIRIVNNIITALFPTENIKPNEVMASITAQNYKNTLNIFFENQLQEGETVEVVIQSPESEDSTTMVTQVITPSATLDYSQVDFIVTTPGLHIITVNKKELSGKVVSTTIYHTISYSAEYDAFVPEETGENFLKLIAVKGNGKVLSSPSEVFANVILFNHREIDPRVLFMIISLVAFLLDIAVRKFKFKWPGEIIRDYKAKKALREKK